MLYPRHQVVVQLHTMAQEHLRGPGQGNDVRPESSDPGNAELRRGNALLFSNGLDSFDDRHVVLEVLANCCWQLTHSRDLGNEPPLQSV